MQVGDKIRALLAERTAELERRVVADAAYQASLDAHVQKVRDGEQTTGDTISDLVLATRRTLGTAAEAPYRALAATLSGMSGQLFLVVVRSIEQERDTFSFGPMFTTPSLTMQRFVGILAGDQLQVDLERGIIGLPARSSVRVASSLASRHQQEVIERTFWLYLFGFPPLEKKDVVVGGLMINSGPQLEIIVGTDAVLGTFPTDRELRGWEVTQHILLRRAVRRLSVDVPLSGVEQAFQRATQDAAFVELRRLVDQGLANHRERAIRLINELRAVGCGGDPAVIACAAILGI